jgi:pilus assembly protein CpaB
MRFRTVLLLLIAIGLAGGTAMLARNWLEGQRTALMAQAKPEAKAQVKQVLVAKVEIQTGTFVRPEMLRWQAWPDAALDAAYAVEGQKKIEDFVGALARFPVNPGEPITEAKLVSPGNSGFLAAVLQPGLRAVSVPVTLTSGISGFVFPGDRVDMILTHVIPQEGQATAERRASETVLRDIRVLAIDQKVETKNGEPVVARSATVEVTPKQGEIIAVVQEMGRLSLSLRSLAREDAEPATIPSATLDSDVSRLLPALFAKPGAASGPAKKEIAEVTVLRGSRSGNAGGAPAPASAAVTTAAK